MKTPRHFSSGIVDRVAILVCTLGFLIGPTGCKPKLNSPGKQSDILSDKSDDWSDLVAPVPVETEEVSYPIEKTIRNAEGQELEGAILAKRGDQILFRRTVDGREFVVPFSNLNTDVQEEFSRLPDAMGEKIDAALNPEVPAPRESSRTAIGAEIHQHATFDEAMSAAKESGRTVLVIFTGVPMSSLDEEDETGDKAAYRKAKRESEGFIRSILSDGSFERYVNENFEFMHVDMLDPDKITSEDRRTQQKAGGASGIFNFPVAVLLDSNGREIDTFGDFGSKGANSLINKLERSLKGWD